MGNLFRSGLTLCVGGEYRVNEVAAHGGAIEVVDRRDGHDYFRALLEVATVINSSLEPTVVLHKITEQTAKAMNCKASTQIGRASCRERVYLCV